MSELGHEVIVAHARNVRLIGRSPKKEGRRDARTPVRPARIDPQLVHKLISLKAHKGTIREDSRSRQRHRVMPSGEKRIQKEILSAVSIEKVRRIEGLECLRST